MSRNSNVLVIAPDAREAMDYRIPSNASLDSVEFDASPLSLGATFVLHAQSEGHATHAMNAGMTKEGKYTTWNTTLDTWWSHYDVSQGRRPNWILLAVIDPGFGWENLIWRDSKRFFQESTITYIVTAVRSRFVGNTLEMYGMDGARALIEKRYKLQVLQVSHYHVEYTGTTQQQGPSVFEQYGPNALLKREKDIESLLLWGAESARRYSNATAEFPVFTAYLFGTQGLDLAIPSRRQYIHDDSRLVGDESWTQINLYKPVKFQPCRPKTTVEIDLKLNFDKV